MAIESNNNPFLPLFYSPNEVHRNLFYNYLSFQDWEICSRVCKLFNNFLTDQWEKWSIILSGGHPYWDKVWKKLPGGPTLSSKRKVKLYKTAENKMLEYISSLYENQVSRKILKNNLHGLVEPFSQSNNPIMQRLLGDAYENGSGCLPDVGIACLYYEMAANQGDAQAQSKLGYLCNTPSFDDRELSFTYHQKAAHQGEINSLAQLSYYYKEGIGCIKDLYSAFDYASLAVKRALPGSTAIADHQSINRDIFKSINIVIEAYAGQADYKDYEGKDVNKAVYYAEAGSALLVPVLGYAHPFEREIQCLQFLVDAYMKGRGCEQNVNAGFYCASRVADYGYPAKLISLFADIKLFLRIDPMITFTYFKKKSKKTDDEGEPWALIGLGWHYEMGRACRKNKKQAEKYYSEALSSQIDCEFSAQLRKLLKITQKSEQAAKRRPPD